MSVDSLGPFLKTPPRARFLWSLHFSSSSRPRRFCNATPLTPLAAAELPVSETEVEKGCSIFAIQHLYGFLDLISDCVRQPRRSCFMEIKDKCTEAEHSSSSNSHLLRLHEILEVRPSSSMSALQFLMCTSMSYLKHCAVQSVVIALSQFLLSVKQIHAFL